MAVGWASATRAYGRGVPGAYRAIVYQEAGGDLALLPHRERAREIGRGERGRIIWSTGTIEGWWTLPELQAAERHGARIERITRANLWSHEEPIFAPYIGHVYGCRLRAEAAGDREWAEAMKLAANALSGKLAQQAHADVVQILGRDDDPLIGWRWHGGRVWSQRVRRVAPSARPIVAATMTALVRVRVLDRLMRHAGRWLYCDTDSTYLEQPDESDTGNALGAWKSEGVARSWRALAPKLYRYRDAYGNEEVRARGIAGATWATIDDIAAGLATSPDGRARIRAGLRVGRSDVVLGWRDVDREWAGMRRVDPRTGRTVPLHRFADGQYALPGRD